MAIIENHIPYSLETAMGKIFGCTVTVQQPEGGDQPKRCFVRPNLDCIAVLSMFAHFPSEQVEKGLIRGSQLWVTEVDKTAIIRFHKKKTGSKVHRDGDRWEMSFSATAKTADYRKPIFALAKTPKSAPIDVHCRIINAPDWADHPLYRKLALEVKWPRSASLTPIMTREEALMQNTRIGEFLSRLG